MKSFLSLLIALLLSCVCLAQSKETAFVVRNESVVLTSLEIPKVIFRRSNGATISVKMSDLSQDQLKRVMDYTGWGRVWEDSTGKYHRIADLVEIHDDAVTLENTKGLQYRFDLSLLSSVDQKYVEARRSSDELPEKFYAKVTGVTDGDTVKVLLNKRQFKIRLSGIDAPETGQAFGKKAKKELSGLVFGKFVSGTTEDIDRYGRNVCTLTVEGKRTDYEMLKAGLCWHYLKYSKDPKRADYEREAKSRKLNIWCEGAPVAPWDWRRWGSAERKAWLAEQSGNVQSSRPPPPTRPREADVLAESDKAIGSLAHTSNEKPNESNEEITEARRETLERKRLRELAREALKKEKRLSAQRSRSSRKLRPLKYSSAPPNSHWVNPYTRKDGTHVRGHWRTNPRR